MATANNNTLAGCNLGQQDISAEDSAQISDDCNEYHNNCLWSYSQTSDALTEYNYQYYL
jgi:hypothetical protein